MRSNNQLSEEQRVDMQITGVRLNIDNFSDGQLKILKDILRKEEIDRENDRLNFESVGDLHEEIDPE